MDVCGFYYTKDFFFFGSAGYLCSHRLLIDLVGLALPPALGGFRRRLFV